MLGAFKCRPIAANTKSKIGRHHYILSDRRLASPMELELRDFIKRALAEDIGRGDVTSILLIPAEHHSKARMIAKGEFVVAGMQVAREVFATLDATVKFTAHTSDGQRATYGDVIATIEGPTRSVLGAERVALNLLQRMCGIATLTAKFVKAVEGTRAKVLDTRKTTPGLRMLEKYAVRMGGGVNHRYGLDDGVLIKDNHLRACGGVRVAIERARSAHHLLKIECECESMAQVREALEAGADVIMLDNMTHEQVREAVAIVAGRVPLEVSGGVNLDNIRELALCGVDYISIGALTHSAPAADISLKF